MSEAEQPFVTYQLYLRLSHKVKLSIGKLGVFEFPEGMYIYTGSAKRGLESRIQRHLAKQKTLRWHIDYLIASDACQILEVRTFHQSECSLCQQTKGSIIVPGFGSSDCTSGCVSHLKYLGDAARIYTY